MTEEILKIANVLKDEMNRIEWIKARIQNEYDKMTDSDSKLKRLLSDCNEICTALKEVKENRFKEL